MDTGAFANASKEALTKVLEALSAEDRATVEQNIAAGPGTEARPPPSTRSRYPFVLAKGVTNRVHEYARLAMGFAHVRASRYGIR